MPLVNVRMALKKQMSEELKYISNVSRTAYSVECIYVQQGILVFRSFLLSPHQLATPAIGTYLALVMAGHLNYMIHQQTRGREVAH